MCVHPMHANIRISSLSHVISIVQNCQTSLYHFLKEFIHRMLLNHREHIFGGLWINCNNSNFIDDDDDDDDNYYYYNRM